MMANMGINNAGVNIQAGILYVNKKGMALWTEAIRSLFNE